MNQTGSKCPCPGFRLALSQDRWDPGDTSRSKVEGAMFPDDSVPDDGRPHWEIQEGLFEFQSGILKNDAYDDIEELGDDEGGSAYVGVRRQLNNST